MGYAMGNPLGLIGFRIGQIWMRPPALTLNLKLKPVRNKNTSRRMHCKMWGRMAHYMVAGVLVAS